MTGTFQTGNVSDSNHPPMDRERKIRKVTWIGLCLNVVLSAVKISAGVFGHSQAVLADGIHSISDTVTDFAVIIGSYYWSKPPDKNHHQFSLRLAFQSCFRNGRSWTISVRYLLRH